MYIQYQFITFFAQYAIIIAVFQGNNCKKYAVLRV